MNRTLYTTNHSAALNLPAIHNWNWKDYDNSYKNEESNLFYHANIAHDFFTKGSPFDNKTGMNYQMPANVEVDCCCNAYATGSSINFYGPGGGCDSLALSSDVIYHEYTHNVVHNVITVDFPYWDQTGNMNEGFADYFACTINDNPCLSEGFLGMDCLRNCDNTDKYPEDYDPEPHSGAQIFSGSMWDTREALGAELADSLVIMAMKLQPTSFSQFLDDMLLADENNGDLSDGTPHINEICHAFADNHGELNPQSGWLNIFIYPGYKFRLVNKLITNFHLPKSTLLILVSAMASEKFITKAYQAAIDKKYKFFSFKSAY